MLKRLSVYLQYILPQHALSRWIGCLAASKRPFIKSLFIAQFMRRYQIDLSHAEREQAEGYESFNDFFTRSLKPALRPIAMEADTLISPVDGMVAQAGTISRTRLIQAKEFYFDLDKLVGGDKALTETFTDGSFATFYLAPHNYHRIHMPIRGRLLQTQYIPGRLFSVNRLTSEIVPSLYSRNERLICLFETEAGPLAVILVGAMIVGSIKTAWLNQPVRAKHPFATSFSGQNLTLEKGQELGQFLLGSTVILLFGKNQVAWTPELAPDSAVIYGQAIGNILLKG